MRGIIQEIAALEQAFARQPFFELLRQGRGSVEDVRQISRGMTFFILAFQDALRITAKRTKRPDLKLIA
jgi:hypothetical protein